MPLPRRKCATCRYFQSNQLSGNGWCTHPSRQTSSDVRILVRKDELACRNSWGSDLWVSADGEQPVASPTPAPETTDSLPAAMQRRDDEVTSLVHRDAPSRAQIADAVERDDIMVVEASLVPERRPVEDDAGNAAAHADQEHRARILARGGNHSAIQDARERMLARRTTPASPDVTAPADEPASDPVAPPAPDAADDAVGPVAAGPTDTATVERTSTPDDAPIRPLAPRPFGGQGLGQRSRATESEGSSSSVDDDDRYNSIPPLDPTIDLPLANTAERDHSPSASDPAAETADPASGEQVTVYDAVLERALAIRAATGREPVRPAVTAQDRVPPTDEAAREEKRARRRITAVPPVVTPPAAVTAPTPARMPQPGSDPATRRPQPNAASRRPAGAPVERTPAAQQPAPRMGIAIAAIKQEAPARAPDSRPEPQPQPQPQSRTQPTARALDPSLVRGIDFHRVPVEDTMANPEQAPGPGLPRRTQARPADTARNVPAAEDAILPYDEEDDRLLDDDAPFMNDAQDDDGYLADVDADVDEESLAASRRGPFGRFRSLWRKDREAIREHQVMASVRDALAGTDEYWEEPFVDEAADPDRDPMQPRTEDMPAPAPQQLPERGRDHVAAHNNTDPAAPRPAIQPERPQGRSGPAPSRPATPGRANGLYRPVHEGAFRDTAADVEPDYERIPAPSAHSDRFDRGNGATVLRIRADAQDDPFDDAWTSPEAEPLVPAPRRPAHHDRVRDAFRPLDAPPDDPVAFIPDLPEPELQLELVEPAPPVSASPWSFEPPVDLDSIEGMDAFRGRLFGDAAVPRRANQGRQMDRQPDRTARRNSHRTERQPGDDVVLDVPPRAEVTSAPERSPLPPKDSPLRSANYRPQEAPPARQTGTAGISRSMPDPAPERRQAAPHALSRPVDYLEEPRAGRVDDPDPAAFDIRDVLTGARDPIDLGVSIAPDVPRACRTCRDFRPSENGERGFCANNWAFTHRQMVNADDLPCQSTIGCWWLPSDRVWMPEERSETSAHRVDALLPTQRRARSG